MSVHLRAWPSHWDWKTSQVLDCRIVAVGSQIHVARTRSQPTVDCRKLQLTCWKCFPKHFLPSCLPHSTHSLNMPTRRITETKSALAVFLQSYPLLGWVPITLTQIIFRTSRLQDFWTWLAQENKAGLRGKRFFFTFLRPAVLGDKASSIASDRKDLSEAQGGHLPLPWIEIFPPP